jgi:hypothetical protein
MGHGMAPAWVVIAVSLLFVGMGSLFLLLRNIFGHVEVSPFFHLCRINSKIVGRKGMVILNQSWGIFFLVTGLLLFLFLIPSKTLRDFLIPLMFLWFLCFIIIDLLLYFDLKRHPRNGGEVREERRAEESFSGKFKVGEGTLQRVFLWGFLGLFLSGVMLFPSILVSHPRKEFAVSIMVAWVFSLIVFILRYLQWRGN